MIITNIVIQKKNETTIKLVVKIPTSKSQHNQGLMYIEKLDGYDGMLFDFGENQYLNMWMKNTFIPLDILFFDSDRNLINIIENTIPCDQTSLGSRMPARYVLEVASGIVKKFGITVGDHFK